MLKSTVLWNAMIHPFLNMTIYGAIWYQGSKAMTYERCFEKFTLHKNP